MQQAVEFWALLKLPVYVLLSPLYEALPHTPSFCSRMWHIYFQCCLISLNTHLYRIKCRSAGLRFCLIVFQCFFYLNHLKVYSFVRPLMQSPRKVRLADRRACTGDPRWGWNAVFLLHGLSVSHLRAAVGGARWAEPVAAVRRSLPHAMSAHFTEKTCERLFKI